MSEYTIFWINGQKTECEGENERDAFRNAGYTSRSFNVVDFVCLKEASSNFIWDIEKKRWKNISINK